MAFYKFLKTLREKMEWNMKTIFIILMLSVSFSKLVYSNNSLSCNNMNYNNTGYSTSWGKSWIPENVKITRNGDEMYISGKKVIITEDSDTKLKFYRKQEHNTKKNSKNSYTIVKYIYFKTTNKLNVSFLVPGGFRTAGDIWGECKLD